MTAEENDPTPFIQAMAAGLRSIPALPRISAGIVLAKKPLK